MLSQHGLVHIGLESLPTKTEAQIANDLDYPSLVAEIENALKPLFIAYAVSNALNPSVKTVGSPLGDLLISSPRGPAICPNKLRGRVIALLRASTLKVGLAATRACKAAVEARATALSVRETVSGKDYALPFVLMRFKARCGYSGNREQFKVALAKKFDVGADPYLRRRLRNIAA